MTSARNITMRFRDQSFKCYDLILVTYKCIASHDHEPMCLIYETIFKKRVCISLISHDLQAKVVMSHAPLECALEGSLCKKGC